jgi:transposase InsO family protein
MVLSAAFRVAPRSYQPGLRFTIQTTVSITGTSISTPTTVASAAPEWNTVWLADIIHLPTGEGWLYLATVLDLATRKIVGWSMRDHMRTELSVAALMMAAQRQRPAAGLTCHSDRGSQHAAEAYRKQLASMGAKPSMSRTAQQARGATPPSWKATLRPLRFWRREARSAALRPAESSRGCREAAGDFGQSERVRIGAGGKGDRAMRRWSESGRFTERR